jgi:hypothetical protein
VRSPPSSSPPASTTRVPGSGAGRPGSYGTSAGADLVDHPTVVTNHAITLAGDGDGGTRLQLRVRGCTRPWWLTAAYVAALVPADHVMAGGMLAGIGRWAAPVSGGGPGARPGS